MNQVLLIDANNLCHRAFWSRRGLSSRGRPTSVLAGTLSMLATIARKMPDTPMVWVWDGGGQTWRHKLLAKRGTYKGGRRTTNQADYESVEKQMPVLRRFLKDVMGFRNVLIPGVEADDVIGVLSQALLQHVVIYSGDRDFYQLISDKVDVWRPKAGESKPTLVTDKAVRREFKVGVRQWIKYRALCGDASDKIPNACKGVGPKTAALLVKIGVDASAVEFRSMPLVVKVHPKVAPLQKHWRNIHENYELCKIVCDASDKRLPIEARVTLNYYLDKKFEYVVERSATRRSEERRAGKERRS